MITADTLTKDEPQSDTGGVKRTSWLPAMVAALVALLLIAIAAGVDLGYQTITSLETEVQQKTAAVAILKQQLNAANGKNSGTVPAAPTDAKTVSLVSGQVTFTMPAGWVLATASNYAEQCYNGGLVEAFCLDTTTIVPKALDNDAAASAYGGINIAVYRHEDATNAQDWYVNDFGRAGEYQDSNNQETALTISGHSAFYINTSKAKLEYGSQFNNEYYVIVNKAYVVLITSNVNNNNGPNGTTKFNDNSQYGPTVKSFAESIKMQGN